MYEEEFFLLLFFLAIVVGVIIGILLNVWISSLFYEAAKYKGFPSRKYFWVCFFFGWIGYLLVIALPSRNIAAPKGKRVSDELPDL